MQKRVATKAAPSEQLATVLPRLVSQSNTLRKTNQHLGQLFLGDDSTHNWIELQFNNVGQQTISEIHREKLFLVFDTCGWMDCPIIDGAQWTVHIDSSFTS